MQYTENLRLNLPEDSDPLEVSKLSENFEKLDKAAGIGGGGNITAIVSGMKVGDITYSARNLEEESGGVLVACDQRTIDTEAYPDIPEGILFWPYPELVFTDTGFTSAPSFAPTYPQPSDANTEDWIYTNMCYKASSNSAARSVAAYSLKEQKAYSSANTLNYDQTVVRVAKDRLLLVYMSGAAAAPFFANNDLTKSDVSLPSTIAAALRVTYGAIARIDENRFFLVVHSDLSSVPHGFYTTDDGFLTLQSLSMPSTAASEMSYASLGQSVGDILNYALMEHPFYPIRKMKNGEMLVVFRSTSKSANLSNNVPEEQKRTNVKACLPKVWRTAENCARIAVDTIGGQGLIDWIFGMMPATTETSYPQFEIDYEHNLPLDGKYLFLATFGASIYNGSSWASSYTDSYFVLVDLETDEFKVSKRYDYNEFRNRFKFTSNAASTRLLYNRRANTIHYFESDTKVSVFDLDSLSFGPYLEIFDGVDTSKYPVNYMPSATALTFSNKFDKRMHERGIEAAVATASCILTDDITALDFSSMSRPSRIDGSSSSKYSRIVYPDPVAPNNLTEFNGDLYWGQNGSLYRIPKNKRQLPYIPNAYMKVLDEPVEEVAE